MIFDWLLVTRNVKHVKTRNINIILYSYRISHTVHYRMLFCFVLFCFLFCFWNTLYSDKNSSYSAVNRC